MTNALCMTNEKFHVIIANLNENTFVWSNHHSRLLNFFKILVSWPEEMVITYFYRWFAFKLRACIIWKAITMKCDRNWSCIPVYSWSHHDQRLTLCTKENEQCEMMCIFLLNLQAHIKLVITMLINMQFFGNALMSA